MTRAEDTRAGTREVQREYPLYYSAHTDPESRKMADLFLSSLRENGGNASRVVPREATVEKLQRTMAERFGTKTALIKAALEAQEPGSYAVVTELDVRFFPPGARVADLIDDALERCGFNCDAVFQREDDTSLHRNLGFMARRRV